MAVMKHLHIYEKIKDKPGYFRCLHPDCTHFAKRSLIIGKRASCVCGEPFVLDYDQLKLRRPHCPRCTRGKKQQQIVDLIRPEDLLPIDFATFLEENKD
jgi:hypothetical protein